MGKRKKVVLLVDRGSRRGTQGGVAGQVLAVFAGFLLSLGAILTLAATDRIEADVVAATSSTLATITSVTILVLVRLRRDASGGTQ